MDKHTDMLSKTFLEMTEDELSPSFRLDMMEKIMAESVRLKKRNERLELIAVIAASIVILVLGGLMFYYLKIKPLSVDMPVVKFDFSYLYMGVLGFILLGFDYWMRKLYKKKHEDNI